MRHTAIWNAHMQNGFVLATLVVQIGNTKLMRQLACPRFVSGEPTRAQFDAQA